MCKYVIWLDKKTSLILTKDQMLKPKYLDILGGVESVENFIKNYNPLVKNIINGY